ncbi:MAG: DUF4956 domain-containing protein [Flavobacteriales bacterium]
MLLKLKLSLLALFFLATPLFLQAEDAPEEDNSHEEYSYKEKKKNEYFFSGKIEKLSKKFFARLAIDVVSVLVLVGFIYYRNYRRKELFLTYISFNIMIFFITFFLNKVDIGMGAAFGLFAVFSMLRYRTENISAKDMTYLFIVIAIGLITAVSKLSALELCLVNFAVLLLVYLLEGNIFGKKEFSRIIQYDNIHLVKPEKQQELIDDLKNKTGFNIHKISIEKINFVTDSISVKIYYYEDEGASQIVPSSTDGDEK